MHFDLDDPFIGMKFFEMNSKVEKKLKAFRGNFRIFFEIFRDSETENIRCKTFFLPESPNFPFFMVSKVRFSGHKYPKNIFNYNNNHHQYAKKYGKDENDWYVWLVVKVL